MSTRSNIIVKVRKEDIGKYVMFSKKRLGVELSDWDIYGDTSEKEKAVPVKLRKNYIGVYCHCDGYPDGLGKVLLEKFNSYDSVLNLVAGGSCSSVWFDMVRRYANRKGEAWKHIQPQQTDKLEVVGGWTEWAYIFDNGKWYFGEVNEDDEITNVGLLNDANIENAVS